MLSKEEKKWFEKNKQKIWEKAKDADLPLELDEKIIDLYLQQPDEIRRAIRRFGRLAIEEGEDGNWQEYAAASFRLMGIDARIVNKKKKNRKYQKMEVDK